MNHAPAVALTLTLTLTLTTAAAATAGAASPVPVTKLKVTVLSTMLAGDPEHGVGEWGFAALVEADGHSLLVDTGARPETVLRNAGELGLDLSAVADVVLTHNHDDHTGGLLALRRELARKNPAALSRAHVAQGIFLSRLNAPASWASAISWAPIARAWRPSSASGSWRA